MVFRDDDHFSKWPLPGQARQFWPQRQASREDDEKRLSPSDTLRELAVTIAGFVGAIVLIVAAIRALHG